MRQFSSNSKYRSLILENDGKSSPPNNKDGGVKRGADSDSDGSSSKKSKKEESKNNSNNGKEAKPSTPSASSSANKGHGQTSFPASSTTDAVRLKCRELLYNAIKGEGGKVSQYFDLYVFSVWYTDTKIILFFFTRTT